MMAVHSIDNRLDNSYLWNAGPAPHEAYNYQTYDPGTLSLWRSVDNRGVSIALKFPAGATPLVAGHRSVLWLKPRPEWSYQLNRSDFIVTPGERLRFSCDLALGGNGWNSTTPGVSNKEMRQFNIGVSYRLESGGTRWHFSEFQAVDYSRASFSVDSTPPPDVTSAYLMVRYLVKDLEPRQAEGSLLVFDPYFGPADPSGAVAEVDVSTPARQGIIADVSARGHDKVPLALADVADEYQAGQRVALAAAARSAADLVWKWRQVQGPEVELNATGNTATFIAPDVTEPTKMRIAVMASSVTGQSRSDWKFFDLTVGPAFASYRADPDVADPASVMPAISGYERGAYEVWNGTLPPPTMPPAPRRQAEIIDIGAMLDDVQVGEQFPESAPRGGFFINSVTGDVFRNFGDGYNETESSRAGAPRRGAIWHDPGTGDLLRWIED